MAYFNFYDRIAKLRDNRLIAKGVNKIPSTNGCAGYLVRVPDLRYIEEVIHMQFVLDNFNCTTEYLIGPEMNKKIVGNLVGFSLYVVTATSQSIQTTVLAIGPP